MALKLPSIQLEIPKPRLWDLITVGLLALGVVVTLLNVLVAGGIAPGVSLNGTITTAFATAQLVVCLGCLMLLGKTSKEGTIWGTLASIGGMFLGITGVLLAAALWTVA